MSANVHRRHLTAEQKRDVIAKLLKAQPESSNRTIAKTVTADHKTVAAVRSEMEGRGEIPHLETRTDTNGRKPPAHKPKPIGRWWEINPVDGGKWECKSPDGATQIVPSFNDAIALRQTDADTSAEERKAEYAATEPTDEMIGYAANGFHEEISDIIQGLAPRFRGWFNTITLPDEAKDSLHNILMLAADELMTLAQEMDGRGAAAEAEAAA